MVEAEPEQAAVEGDNVTLMCNVTSFPEPRISWFRVEGGTEVSLLDQESGDLDFGEYTILSVDRNDAGIYRCTGRYTFDVEHVDIELVVLSKWNGIQYVYSMFDFRFMILAGESTLQLLMCASSQARKLCWPCFQLVLL